MEDKSIIKNIDSVDVNPTYINDCIKEVCLKGDSLTKYKRMIEKQYGAEFYQKCGNFVKEVKRSEGRKKFTQTSQTNLKYLANEINITSDTVDAIINYFTKTFVADEKKEKTVERKRSKREIEKKKIDEETALMKKVVDTEQKRSVHEIEEKKRQEEEKKRKTEERRKRAEERRRQQRLDKEKQRKEEEEERLREVVPDKEQGSHTAIGCGIIIAILVAIRFIWPDLFLVILLIGIFGFLIYFAIKSW